jgi:ABC-type glutathione transport system ATPase component
VQAQIVNLLRELSERHGMALLFISHNLAVVRHLCEEIACCVAAGVVEQGTREAIFTQAPRSLYSANCWRAVPEPDPRLHRWTTSRRNAANGGCAQGPPAQLPCGRLSIAGYGSCFSRFGQDAINARDLIAPGSPCLPDSSRPAPASPSSNNEIPRQACPSRQEMERMGYDIVSLNIGNPGLSASARPRRCGSPMIENLRAAEGYCHQKGIFPAREAVVMQAAGSRRSRRDRRRGLHWQRRQ